MSESDTIHQYYLCFKERDRGTLEKIPCDDLVFRSPWAEYSSGDAMLDDIWPLVGERLAVDIEVFSNGCEYLVHYCHNTPDSPAMVKLFRFRAIASVTSKCIRPPDPWFIGCKY